jgi:predicted HTH transcriptional regulator
MRTVSDISTLLDELDEHIADDLEGQDLDFKQWDAHSREAAVKTVVQMAVCMANGGGGTVVFGVKDRVKGRANAILGVPPEINTDRLKMSVYNQTDPKITPVFETLPVPEGTGRLIVMHIYPGMPPYRLPNFAVKTLKLRWLTVKDMHGMFMKSKGLPIRALCAAHKIAHKTTSYARRYAQSIKLSIGLLIEYL